MPQCASNRVKKGAFAVRGKIAQKATRRARQPPSAATYHPADCDCIIIGAEERPARARPALQAAGAEMTKDDDVKIYSSFVNLSGYCMITMIKTHLSVFGALRLRDGRLERRK